MSTTAALLADLLRACDRAPPGLAGDRLIVDASTWLDGDVDLVELYAVWTSHWSSILDVCRATLGAPSFDDTTARTEVDAWYPEAKRIACWRRGDRLVYLAIEHHDRETPIAVTLGWISDAEIESMR
jgi:hypothetical protein